MELGGEWQSVCFLLSEQFILQLIHSNKSNQMKAALLSEVMDFNTVMIPYNLWKAVMQVRKCSEVLHVHYLHFVAVRIKT